MDDNPTQFRVTKQIVADIDAGLQRVLAELAELRAEVRQSRPSGQTLIITPQKPSKQEPSDV